VVIEKSGRSGYLQYISFWQAVYFFGEEKRERIIEMGMKDLLEREFEVFGN